MAAPGFGTSPFILPQMFDKPGDTLQQGLAMKERRDERQFEMNWRLQRQKEADDWKKLQLIQELTDVDKYQTGESVADAIGHQKANEIFSKYTALAGSLTPAELQYKIAQDIGSTTNGMRSLKDELVLSDQAVKARKAQFPSLDTGTLMRDLRADIIDRRIKGSEFANPMTVQPSQYNLDDLDFLSDYIDVNKGLKDAVVNPKNIQKDVTVLRGTPSSYVVYQGDLPYYMKDNQETQGGFYNKKPEPTMSLKTTAIPQGSFAGADQQIDVLDKDAYEGLKAESAEVDPALRKLARAKYRNYSSMSNADKEIAMRDVAKDFITPFSENYKYRAKSATKPPHYSNTTNYNVGGGTDWKNIYKDIKQTMDDTKKKGSSWTPMRVLSPAAKEVIVGMIKNNTGASEVTQEDYKLIEGDDGSIRVFDKGDEFVTLLPKSDVNIKGNQPLGIKAKQEALKNSKNPPVKKDPLGLFQ